MWNGNIRYLFWNRKPVSYLFRHTDFAYFFYCTFSLISYSLLADAWGIVALWIGFGRQSVTVTIVAAVIISIVMCQIMAMTLNYLVGSVLFLVIGSVAAVIAWADLKRNIANMEV